MYKMPMVSVVMSVYREPLDWLHQSIDSILKQSFSDFEFIIICDNPNYEEGIQLLKEYAIKDSRIRLFFNDANIGLTRSLNKGLGFAKGQYVARMDADDMSKPERLERQICFLESHPEVDICGSNAKMFGSRDDVICCPQNNEQVSLFLDNCFVHSAVMMKKAVADLRYNEECKAAQDYELWFRAQQHGFIFYNLQEELVLYRISKGQVSQKNKSIQDNVASSVRRASLDALLEIQNIPIELGNDLDVTFDFISEVYDLVKVEESKKKKLLYYLLLSVNYKKHEILFFLCRKGILTYLPLSYTIRIFLKNNKEVRMF